MASPIVSLRRMLEPSPLAALYVWRCCPDTTMERINLDLDDPERRLQSPQEKRRKIRESLKLSERISHFARITISA